VAIDHGDDRHAELVHGRNKSTSEAGCAGEAPPPPAPPAICDRSPAEKTLPAPVRTKARVSGARLSSAWMISPAVSGPIGLRLSAVG
jgi:hypothetical protein